MQAETLPPITMRNRLSLAQAARLVDKSPSCLFRWHRDGVQGVRLDCLRFGRSLFTSEAALEQFARDVAEAHHINRTSAADVADSEPVAGL
jgi:hypothetical protein